MLKRGFQLKPRAPYVDVWRRNWACWLLWQHSHTRRRCTLTEALWRTNRVWLVRRQMARQSITVS